MFCRVILTCSERAGRRGERGEEHASGREEEEEEEEEGRAPAEPEGGVREEAGGEGEGEEGARGGDPGEEGGEGEGGGRAQGPEREDVQEDLLGSTRHEVPNRAPPPDHPSEPSRSARPVIFHPFLLLFSALKLDSVNVLGHVIGLGRKPGCQSMVNARCGPGPPSIYYHGYLVNTRISD